TAAQPRHVRSRARVRGTAARPRGEVPRRAGPDDLRRRRPKAAAPDRRATRLSGPRAGAGAMAQLILESARAARMEAERTRAASWKLRRAVHENNLVAHARTERVTAAASATMRARSRAMIFPSPWSGLSWRHGDEQLERTLVPLD